MNSAIWLVAGGILGWIAYTALHFNEARGRIGSIIIGAASAYFGGSVLSPLLANSGTAVDSFNPLALVVASAAAVAFLYLGELIYQRYGA